MKNQIKMSFRSLSENVAIARVAAAAFAAQTDLTINDIEEIKVAISEAVTNATIHGYGCECGEIIMAMTLYDEKLEFTITDFGRGIEDVQLACQPSYSTDPERMGLGLVFMDSFMDELVIDSTVGQGTTVTMIKYTNDSKKH